MKRRICGALLILMAGLDLQADTITSAFYFSDQLTVNGTAANGNYDFTFKLFNALTNGNLVAGPVTNLAVAVVSGSYTTVVDFGTNIFNGSNYWLEVAVRSSGPGTFTTLSPRLPILADPYASYALVAGSATSANSVLATNIVGRLGWSQLPSGILSNNASGVTLQGTFSGNGQNLTNVSVQASNVLGRLGSAQLPAGVLTNNASGVTLQGTFSGNGQNLTNVSVQSSNVLGRLGSAQLPSGILSNNASGVTLQGTFSGNGQNLTNVSVQASNVLGPLGSAQLPASVLTNNASGVTLQGTFSGNGQNLTNVSVQASNVLGPLGSAQLPADVLTNNASGITLAGTFAGNGGGLTNLNAAYLAGTLPVGVVTNSNGSRVAYVEDVVVGSVAGSNILGPIPAELIAPSVLTNGAGAVTLAGTFGGNGGGLTNLNAAYLAGTLPAGAVTNSNGSRVAYVEDVVVGSVAGSNILGPIPAELISPSVLTNGAGAVTLAGTFGGNGGGLSNLNAAYLAGTLPAGAVTNSNGSRVAYVEDVVVGSVAGSNILGPIPAELISPSVLTNGAGAVTLAGTFGGNGGGLSNLNAAYLAGTLPAGAVTNSNGSRVAYVEDVVVGSVAGSNILGPIPAALISPSVLTNGAGAVTLAGTFGGNGGGLTNLNAAYLAGTLPAGAVTNSNGSRVAYVEDVVVGSVAGSNILGPIPAALIAPSVVTNGASGVTLQGSFSGDGGNLTNLNFTQQLPPGLLTNNATGVTLQGSFSGDGSQLTNVSFTSTSLSPAGTSYGATELAGTWGWEIFYGGAFIDLLSSSFTVTNITCAVGGNGSNVTAILRVFQRPDLVSFNVHTTLPVYSNLVTVAPWQGGGSLANIQNFAIPPCPVTSNSYLYVTFEVPDTYMFNFAYWSGDAANTNSPRLPYAALYDPTGDLELYGPTYWYGNASAELLGYVSGQGLNSLTLAASQVTYLSGSIGAESRVFTKRTNSDRHPRVHG